MSSSTHIPYAISVRQDEYRRGYIGSYEGPDGIGFRDVTDDRKMVKIFKTRRDAERAATTAMMAMLNEKKEERSLRAKVFSIFGSGKTKAVVQTRGGRRW